MISDPNFLLTTTSGSATAFQELESPEGELHLRFCVASGFEYALPAIGIREVMAPPPDRITPMPNVSPLLLGTFNVRGRVIWVADLGRFLGDRAPLNTDRPEIPVIAIEDQEIMLGLAVDRIGGMEWLDLEDLQAPINVEDDLAPFLRGEWLVDHEEQSFVRLLDQVAILRSARWAA
jgi:purine-binding chemotaxis protein CheW